jgi:hypothetical protein
VRGLLGAAMSACRSCGASIIWTETVNGKTMPLDEDPDPDGNFTLDESHEPPVAEHIAGRMIAPKEERFTSHFATCPDAARFRR